jgi:hypothetical protein
MRPLVRERNGVQAWVFEVDHLAASETDQVVVPVRLRLKARGRSRVAHLASYAELDQGFQNPVYGGSRNSWKASRNVRENLVCRRVIVTLHQSVEHRPPLHGQRDALPAAQGLELFHLDGRSDSPAHAIAMISQMGISCNWRMVCVSAFGPFRGDTIIDRTAAEPAWSM